MYLKVGLNFTPMPIFYHQQEYLKPKKIVKNILKILILFSGIMNKYISEDKSISLFNCDAMELMDKMIEKELKVDCIITDPPYNISKDNNFNTMGRAGIDFGEWDKEFDLYSWIEKHLK